MWRSWWSRISANGVPVARLARTDPAAVRAEVVGNRDRMLAARRAREASGALPDDLNERIRGFQESRAILTALELDVFTAVGGGATAEAVAAKLGTHARATEMLLNALASMGLLVKQDGCFRNAPAAARWFCAGSPDNARPALLHTAHLWPRWSTLTDCVRGGTAAPRPETGGEDWTEAFIAAMHRNAAERAPQVVRAVGAETVGRMLDVGGGSGAYSIAFAQANPELHSEILDLAAVVPIAQAAHPRGGRRRAGLGARGRSAGGRVGRRLRPDFHFRHLPHAGAGGEPRSAAPRRAALAPGGRIAIQDFILEPDKTAPKWGALFALNMLVGTPSGSSYSEVEYAAWLEIAGFTGHPARAHARTRQPHACLAPMMPRLQFARAAVALAAMAVTAGQSPAPISIDYPQDESIFPPEHHAAHLPVAGRRGRGHLEDRYLVRRWRAGDSCDLPGASACASAGSIRIAWPTPTSRRKLTPELAAAHTWIPDRATWHAIRSTRWRATPR